jgi:spermidine synthase
MATDPKPTERPPFHLPDRPETWFEERALADNVRFCLRVERQIFSRRSPYQRVDIYDTQAFGRLMTIDGLVMVCERDEFVYHDMIVHVPLFSHPAPRNVLIIGGGDGGTLREVLKHDGIERVVMVELDEVVVEAAREHLPALSSGMDDPRAEVRIGDGLAYVREAGEGAFDVVIVDCTDPVGPAEGLFRRPFYEDCVRILGDDGIVCQQTESPLYSPELVRAVPRTMREAGFVLTRTAQAHCVSYPSGWWTFTLGSKRVDPATGFRADDAAGRRFRTRYYNEALHRGCFMLPTLVRELVE